MIVLSFMVKRLPFASRLLDEPRLSRSAELRMYGELRFLEDEMTNERCTGHDLATSIHPDRDPRVSE